MSFKETLTRIQNHFRFSWQEISGLIGAVIITAFIFSFRDWGTDFFDFFIGIKNLLFVIIIAAISFFFRISCQKIYGLSNGYKVEFKVWWLGIIIALVLGFISMGTIPLIIIGGAVASFMVRQRLGEFRYGFSYAENGIISLWGILGNLIMAILFSIGAYAWPQSYFFHKGVILNLVMAACAIIPLPQLDGLCVFFGSRVMYVLGIFTVLLAAVLLLTGTMVGLIVAIIIGTISIIIYFLVRSEK